MIGLRVCQCGCNKPARNARRQLAGDLFKVALAASLILCACVVALGAMP